MSTTPQITDDQPEVQQPTDTSQEQTQDPNDLGDWNERLVDNEPELVAALIKLDEHFCDQFKYPRRLEVMKAWQARSFWRESQHLTWDWGGECWDVLGPAGWTGSPGQNATKDSAVLYSTNMYQRFGKIFQAVITQAVPNLRFEPEDTEEAADIESAKVADDFKKYIQHENDPIKLMTKAAFIAWTDGRMHGWTRWEIDKRTKTPRETQSIVGVMEVKVPVIYDEQCDYPYLQYSQENHLSTVRAKVKSRKFTDQDYWKKVKGGSSGSGGQSEYERIARISIKQGISIRAAGGDAYGDLCTTRRSWLRPSTFMEDCVEDKLQDRLLELFPDGVYLETDNGVYTGSKNANMDDEWAVENIMEGDGSNRNAQGTCLVSVQERFNDTINMTQDTFEKMQPAKHLDDKLFDIDAIRSQRSMPGAVYGLNWADMPPGDTAMNHAFVEEPAKVDQSQLLYMEQLGSNEPESLTGLSAILFGADQGGDKSGKALSIQQSAAMGIIGLPFRVMKRMYARMMEQAVRCASRNRKSDVNIGIPDQYGQIQTIQVRVGDLDGNVRCFPDTDENYPESWTAKRATYMQLLMEGNSDPTMKAILSNPKNQNFAKKVIGLQEMEIPDADSWNKQMVEINLLLQEMPQPPQPQPPQQVPNPLQPHIMETIQPPPAPPQSSIPIDPDYDNHAAEFLTVTIWCNSSKGQQMKKANPTGFMNVRLHGLAHKQALMASMPQPAPPVPPMGHPGSAPHAGPVPAVPVPPATPPAAPGKV